MKKMIIEQEDDEMEKTRHDPTWLLPFAGSGCIGQDLEVAYHRNQLYQRAADARRAAAAAPERTSARPSWIRRAAGQRLIALGGAIAGR